ncbi:MAG: hypothetical protein V1766_14805 [Pseudomonadota bacterium]
MKMKEIIEKAVNDWDRGEINQLIRVAYFLGRESATQAICNAHNARIAAMRKRANECRYHNMAHAIIDSINGDGRKIDDVIYSPDYAGDFGGEFGNDEFNGDIAVLVKEA